MIRKQLLTILILLGGAIAISRTTTDFWLQIAGIALLLMLTFIILELISINDTMRMKE